MPALHMDPHGCHAGHHVPIFVAGEAYTIMFMHMVIESFVVSCPEWTQWAEIGVHHTTGQGQLSPVQGILAMHVPEAC